MADKGGRFLGPISDSHPYADPLEPPMEALHPKLLHGLSPEEFMRERPADEDGFFLPGSDLLWIHKRPSDTEVPMSGKFLDAGEA